MDEPGWLLREEVDVVHWQLVEEFGGRHGIRDDHAIESALARPRNGLLLRAPQDEVIRIMEQLAAGERDEDDFARWVREYL